MTLLKENKFRKYLAYATGEIVLVVIGILIALQITNWNQERQETASLEAYLTSISRNIDSDLNEIRALTELREQLFSRLPYLWDNIEYGDNYFTIEEVTLYSQTAFKLMDLKYFIPDLSGYDSLKNSGFLNKLQGKDLELLLYQYYSLVEEIKIMENNFNEVLREGAQQYRQADLDTNFIFFTPSYINPGKLDELQVSLLEHITHKSITLLYEHASSHSDKLIAMYDNLNVIGQQLRRLILKQNKSLDDEAKTALNDVYDFNGNIGYPSVMKNGATNISFFITGFDQSGPAEIWGFNGLYQADIRFKDMAWGVQYYTVNTDTMLERPSKDYSVYKSLRIEAKAPIDEQELLVVMKDADDPDDGSETRVPIMLSTEWQYYDIPLSEFKTADLSNLFMPVGFVFLEKAQTVSIRNIEFVK
ncbi:MAG: hypothetical protein KJO69_08035 [Gammaproteobacteria bacterium]|nr:hypothetical protein [Gammaproteobacteria bacterium]NNJ73524.1 hypothetical protein [Enterobacterales bacterium]